MSEQFMLHEQLAKDTVHLMAWPLCEVLLMNDKNYPWWVLVPRVPGITELYQLEPRQQQQLLIEINAASKALLLCEPIKLNVAALGNVVPQLHIHLIARFTTDPAWPKPIWGVVPTKPYEVAHLPQVVKGYRDWLAVQHL